MTEQIGVHTPKPRFDGTINLGHILSAVVLLVTLGGIGITQVKANAQQAEAMLTLQQSVISIKTEVAAFGPRMTLVEKTNDLNAERITNAANSSRSLREEVTNNLAELRRADSNLQIEVNGVKVSLAGLDPRFKFGGNGG